MRRFHVALLLAFLAVAAPARAGKVSFGSDLSPAANVVRSHPRDWAAWPTKVANNVGSGYTSSVTGEVTQVQFKGTILKPPNDAEYHGRYPQFGIHVVVLRPQENGRMKLIVATEELVYPFGGDEQRVTTYNLQDYDARVCVQPGDTVALSTNGGFGAVAPEYGGFPNNVDFADGYRVQFFSRIPDSSIRVFEEDYGPDADSPTFQVGDTVSHQPVQGEELLMRTTVSTAADARWTCRTKAEQAAGLPNPGDPPPTSSKAVVPVPATAPKVRKRKFALTVSCPGPAKCEGGLDVRTRGHSAGKASFALASGQSAPVTVTISKADAKRLRRDGSLPVKVIAATPAGKTAAKFSIRK